jgi:histidinol-phosphate aminotransferase
MAGLRMGLAYASQEIIDVLNKIKYPYNVNMLTQKLVLEALDKVTEKDQWVRKLVAQRDDLTEMLAKLKLVEKVYPSDANFILVKVPDARRVYNFLVDRKIIIRDRSKVYLCEGCLRITVGAKSENLALYKALAEYECNS